MTKQELIDSFHRETSLISFLASRLTPEDLEFRFSPGQRSTLELLRYLSLAGIAPTIALVNGNWDHWQTYAQRAEDVGLTGVGAAMERQFAEILQVLEPLTEQDLATRRAKTAWNTEMALGAAIVEQSLKFLTAYRMQLFLQAKAASHPAFSTWECWAGVDKPAPKA